MKVARLRIFAVAVFALALATAPVGAQEEHHHTHGDGEQFGVVNFPASCRADVLPTFTRAVSSEPAARLIGYLRATIIPFINVTCRAVNARPGVLGRAIRA